VSGIQGNLEAVRLAATVAQWLITGGVAIYAWIANRQAANAKEVEELRGRVIALEEQMRHLPDQSLVTDLSGDLKAVRAELQGVRETIAPLVRSVDRINDYLLSHR